MSSKFQDGTGRTQAKRVLHEGPDLFAELLSSEDFQSFAEDLVMIIKAIFEEIGIMCPAQMASQDDLELRARQVVARLTWTPALPLSEKLGSNRSMVYQPATPQAHMEAQTDDDDDDDDDDDYEAALNLTIQEPTCSVASSHEGGERKSTRVEQSSLQACLRAVTEENRGPSLRWKAAEAALAHAESEQLDHDALLRAEEAELRVLRLEATVENQRLRFTQVEQKAFEAQEESASLQATSAEAARKVKNLTEQLSRAEALLVKERARLRNEELEAREAKLTLEALQASQVEEREASQRLSVAEALLVKERESVRQERLEVEALTQRLSKAEAALAEERARLETYESEQREAVRNCCWKP
eukprot:g22517.t1